MVALIISLLPFLELLQQSSSGDFLLSILIIDLVALLVHVKKGHKPNGLFIYIISKVSCKIEIES